MIKLTPNSTIKVKLTEEGAETLKDFRADNNLMFDIKTIGAEGESSMQDFLDSYNQNDYFELTLKDYAEILGSDSAFTPIEPTILIDDKEFNANQIVKVKYTKQGLEQLKKQREKARKANPNIPEFTPPEQDKNGYSKEQFWVILDMYNTAQEDYYVKFFKEILIADNQLTDQISPSSSITV